MFVKGVLHVGIRHVFSQPRTDLSLSLPATALLLNLSQLFASCGHKLLHQRLADISLLQGATIIVPPSPSGVGRPRTGLVNLS
ncbi:hypothetical protein HYDPIDRAFT_114589 [Hydnomerulius pinastri MD-312]|uniref:Uncharacterized protein n=1 Tax=Hydnomerulius pinastri MD-312 TaxID=994086 RepID=A0A0C9W6D2_9AGAM|nr:hypothetical protein HYDPIDRAFT_114589 [Hydnomerulius pinastri MD-312]